MNIALIGNTNVGKTALMNSYCRKAPLTLPKEKRVTIGVELEPVWLTILGQTKLKLKIWDTAG